MQQVAAGDAALLSAGAPAGGAPFGWGRRLLRRDSRCGAIAGRGLRFDGRTRLEDLPGGRCLSSSWMSGGCARCAELRP